MFIRAGLMIVTLALPAVAAQPSKAAWEWTLEERIAGRTDAPMARRRIEDARRLQTNETRAASPERRAVVDRFTGRTHPELFLPHEVFEQLIDMGFGADARANEGTRGALSADVQRHGLPADFWERLRTISTVYLADTHALRTQNASIREQAQAADAKRHGQAIALKQKERCRSGVDALEAARAEFGRERFDRFLYQVVATKMFYFADRLPDPVQLRNVAGGCR